MAPTRKQPKTRPHTGTSDSMKPHPSRGGNAYDAHFRVAVREIQNDPEGANSSLMVMLRQNYQETALRCISYEISLTN